MSDDRAAPRLRHAARLTGLSSGIRLLLILTTALLPLGLIALFASIRSAESNRQQHELDAGIIAAQAARQIDQMVVRDARLLKTMVDRAPDGSPCPAILRQVALTIGEPQGIYALYSDRGRKLCATAPGEDAAEPRNPTTTDVLLIGRPAGLRFTVQTDDGGYATGELPIDTIVRSVQGLLRAHGAYLIQGTTRLDFADNGSGGAFDQRVTVVAPMSGGQMALGMTVNVARISALEVLMILLPILMWLAGGLIGWLVVERLLLRPLADLEQAVAGHRAGDGQFAIPRFATPSHEIRNLAEAFRRSAEDQAHHDAELEAGLARQTKLTREVHHRVKNNLQVVASLINLHARGTQGDVAQAYASIQRRVDALAVVHRNHYAEMEENHGINLRTLVAELATNLRGSAPPGVTLGITINMVPANVSQDVAVPIAFLLTEMVELMMECDPAGIVAVTLSPTDQPQRMRLAIEAVALGSDACESSPTAERFRRIIGGLARQLRAPLDFDAALGCYAIDVSVLPTKG